MLGWLRRNKEKKETAARLYGAIVKLARAPVLYRDMEIPDTLDGRFDAVILHVHLILRRLRHLGPEGGRLGQLVFDAMFANMDVALREMGVGDLSVGKKVRRMAEAYFGRAVAYDQALVPGAEEDMLAETLVRNVYGGSPPSAAALARLADHVRDLDARIARLSLDALKAAELSASPSPAEAAA